MSSPLVWFFLLDSATGQPYKGARSSSVYLLPGSFIAQFKSAVKAKYSNNLSSVDVADLLVYKNKAAFDKRNAAGDDGKEMPLEEDFLIDGLGKSKNEALVVAVPSPACSALRGDEIEVDSCANAFGSSSRIMNIGIDGIDLDIEHLKRNELVGKLQWLVSRSSIVLLSSPAASGKSSLFKLYQAVNRNVKVLRISFREERSPFELLSEVGIDLQQNKISESLANKYVVVFIDDAQRKYGDGQFWVSLVKTTWMWMPDNIRFIISATHSLSGGKLIPVEFKSLPSLMRKDFLLTDEEAYQLLEFRDIGLPANLRQHKILKYVLVKQCGGLVGALRLSIDALYMEFFSSRNDDIEEALCLQYCLSDQFVQNMARCFGSAHSYPYGNEFKRYLKECFVGQRIRYDGFSNPQDDNVYSQLKKAGILVELPDSSVGFSSPLAKRYYFKWMFPNRAQTAPSSLRELIQKVVSSMSSTVLKNSTLPGDFPKEAVFQHLFMEGLVLHTPPNCSICPELSKIFPPNTDIDSKQVIAGETDFYLNGSLRWGIELLVNGDGVGEQLSRFSSPDGKYAMLAVNDYAIVDFRRNATGQPTGISKHRNRISVFFKNDDYSVAQCLFGDDTAPIEIRLSN
ncbi:hypothetical protein MIR68_010741 [Amoeboaphelidium protococcarum]|nr:hypothetical protein MIR68_010741 [Amoeboaphelidium protococcarum]